MGVGAPPGGGAITSSGSCRHQPGAQTQPEWALCATRIVLAKYRATNVNQNCPNTIFRWHGMEINSDGFRSRVEWIGFA